VRFAAIGDSFTEGVGDLAPDGTEHGWAAGGAAGLCAARAARGEAVHYANLAIRGRLLRPIVTGQLDAALALRPEPDLLTLNGGGNDMMRPGVRLDGLIDLTERAVRRCAEAGVRLVILSGADPTAQLPFGRTIHRRGAYLTAALADLCTRHDVTFVNVFGDAEIRHHRYWSADRLHLNSAGHARVAGLVLHALGFAPVPSPAAAAPAVARRLAADVRYYREHVLPWVRRRLSGTSSGDDRDPKHPAWHLIEPPAEPPPGAAWAASTGR
jgi:lysophospholipase L1-like esterase